MDKKQAYDLLSEMNFQNKDVEEAIAIALESLQKSDKLDKFPCNIGDTVYIPIKQYYIGSTKYDKSKILKSTVSEIKIGIDNGKRYSGFYSRNGSETRWFNFTDIDKTVFLDELKAEIAL